ncbi:fibronectin type III domain-containing protein [Sulfurimonas sp. MAG313]|nr:fibronectin type III domain-containing protein [Sulfurimonas sp. MAG313]MDF1882250.1 fibronectin type III domain-containing protein [Sulfurimonas sp. MAG313]
MKQINPAQGNSLTPPTTPTFLDALVQNNSAVLTWKNNDKRTKSYTLIKVTQEGWMSTTSVNITDIKETTYTAKNLKSDTKYTFQVMSVDSNKINSEPTLPVDVLITVKK